MFSPFILSLAILGANSVLPGGDTAGEITSMVQMVETLTSQVAEEGQTVVDIDAGEDILNPGEDILDAVSPYFSFQTISEISFSDALASLKQSIKRKAEETSSSIFEYIWSSNEPTGPAAHTPSDSTIISDVSSVTSNVASTFISTFSSAMSNAGSMCYGGMQRCGRRCCGFWSRATLWEKIVAGIVVTIIAGTMTGFMGLKFSRTT